DVDAFAFAFHGEAGRWNAVCVSVFIDPVIEAPRRMQHFIELPAGVALAIEKRDGGGPQRYGGQQKVLETVEQELALKYGDVPEEHPPGYRRCNGDQLVGWSAVLCRHGAEARRVSASCRYSCGRRSRHRRARPRT